jgi:ATP-dependent 26S proteasome regulatory subunit
MNGKVERNWINEVANQRKTLFSNLIIIETEDRKRIDELLKVKPVLANYENRKERWLVLDSWEGLYKHTGTGDENISCKKIECGGDIREYGLRVAIKKVQKELETEDTVLVITNVFKTDDVLNNAIRGWSMSNQLTINSCTVFIFVDDKNVFPQEVWSHTRIVKPPRSTWKERERLIVFTQNQMKKHIAKDKYLDVKNVDNVVRLTAGLNLDQTESSLIESIILKRHLDLSIISELKTKMLASDPVVSIMQRSPFGFEAIGGYNNLKQRLIDEIVLPLKHPDMVKYYDLKPPRGVILFGPPGTGKTVLIKSISRELNMSIIMLRPENVLGKYVGESEKNFKKAFEIADSLCPCILFIDELDRLSKRDAGSNVSSHVERELFSMLLEKLGDENREWFFAAATNMIESIDPALRRTGRVDSVIPVPFPDAKAREEIFKIHTTVKRKLPLKDDINLEEIAVETVMWSGSDIEQMVIRAANMVMKEDLKNPKVRLKIGMEDFIKSIHTFNINVEQNTILQNEMLKQAERYTNDTRMMDVFDHAEVGEPINASRISVADKMLKGK